MTKYNAYEQLEDDRINCIQHNLTDTEARAYENTDTHMLIPTENLNKLWLRVGVEVQFTQEEVAKMIQSGRDNSDPYYIIRTALDEGRFRFVGDSYVPDEKIEGSYIASSDTGKGICLGGYDFNIDD